ncbi:hypothetical protein PHYSODRAFT_285539 [Phytophthora sojae]|uniref:Uncharacterized protein n=1 Tax=Phytophthora sojae (strain P6497) TaxID=1094619 RepID=G4Z661_PHYSP|nr:hypothetical protein PHYSODRAFT_285539 [Phytophthora sojae]EGZ20980.1 hypothetical protein PHYSODRAFT_285539 [Phytophthora sojae]|eukprot:XP_009523697.1 hypothetical protein PHYSODRAFT_285539 [Phytophthora sojae]
MTKRFSSASNTAPSPRHGSGASATSGFDGENMVEEEVRRFHLVGHSMGSQIIHMLAQMLEKGTTGAPEEELDVTSTVTSTAC